MTIYAENMAINLGFRLPKVVTKFVLNLLYNIHHKYMFGHPVEMVWFL